jgi:hypothetical protein
MGTVGGSAGQYKRHFGRTVIKSIVHMYVVSVEYIYDT